MRGEYDRQSTPEDGIREPIFNAMDELRVALDRAAQAGNDRVVGLLLIALQDLADTLDLTGDDAAIGQQMTWAVAKRRLD